jgi:hypothetical protein
MTFTYKLCRDSELAELADIAGRRLLRDDICVPTVCTGRIVRIRGRRVTLCPDESGQPTSAWCESRDVRNMAKRVGPEQKMAMMLFNQPRNKRAILGAIRPLST